MYITDAAYAGQIVDIFQGNNNAKYESGRGSGFADGYRVCRVSEYGRTAEAVNTVTGFWCRQDPSERALGSWPTLDRAAAAAAEAISDPGLDSP